MSINFFFQKVEISKLKIIFSFFKKLLLRKKAAEELKKEQERKAAERRKVIDQRCGKPTETSGMSESTSHIIFSNFCQLLIWLYSLIQ